MNLKAIAAKMTALLLAFSLFAALCACGKNGKEETGGQTSGTGAHDSAAEQTDGTGADEGGEKTDEEEIGFTVSFELYDTVTVTTFKTPEEMLDGRGGTNETVARSRDGESGAERADGSGQINFILTFADGYEAEAISIAGEYEALQRPSETGIANGYRITKIASDLIVNVTTQPIGTP